MKYQQKKQWCTCLILLISCLLWGNENIYGAEQKREHWATPFVQYLKTDRQLYLEEDAYSELDEPISRQEFFALLARAKGLKSQKKEVPFADKDKISDVFLKDVNAAYEAGYIKGVEQKGKLYFYPEKPFNRQEVCSILSQIYGIKSYYDPIFEDKEEIQTWAVPAVSGLSRTGILLGYKDGFFRPNQLISKGESYALLSSILQRKTYLCTVYAGDGEEGMRNGDLEKSSFSSPSKVIQDEEGTIFITDTKNQCIRKIQGNHTSIFAGDMGVIDAMGFPLGGYLNGSVTKARFFSPVGIVKRGKGLVVADRKNHGLRLIINGEVSSLAGNGTQGFQDGKGEEARFFLPSGLSVSEEQKVYVADTGNHAIRVVDTNGNVTTIAGGKAGYVDGDCSQALFYEPEGIAVYEDSIYVADTGNHAIRRIKNGMVDTLAGEKNQKDEKGIPLGDYQDGNGKDAFFSLPKDIVVDKSGTIYVADWGNGLIRRIRNGEVSTLMEWSNVGNKMEKPTGLFVSENILYGVDSVKNQIFTISLETE